MRVLLTGSDGYLGCVAADALLTAGHDVVGLDTGYYRQGWLYDGVRELPRTLVRDVRDVTSPELAGFDAVVHMAELSNDPLGALLPDITYQVNHQGSLSLARAAREAGVSRFVHMSSCSVYGIAEGVVDETTPTDPRTAYAECKALVESSVGALADDGFAPVFLRNATAFGASPRMRFDVVANNLAALAHTTGVIALTSDGSPWRPLVHALDIAQAVRLVLEAPVDDVRGQVLNVGADEQNYRVRDIAAAVGRAYPSCSIATGPPNGDERSYRVSFARIRQVLPTFRCEWDLDRGVAQMADVFRRVQLDAAGAAARAHTRLDQLQWLLETGQVDDDLRWTRALQPARTG